MQAAVIALKRLSPAKIVIAVPVGARDTCARLRHLVDEVVSVAMPEPFRAVGLWYQEFGQMSDEELCRLLDERCAASADLADHRGRTTATSRRTVTSA